MKWNESGFRPPLCTYRLNWARRTSWGWWGEWDDTALQTHDSKFVPWRSEAEHATSRSRRLPTILKLYEWAEKKHFVYLKLEGESGVWTSDLLLSRQTALATTPDPLPVFVGLIIYLLIEVFIINLYLLWAFIDHGQHETSTGSPYRVCWVYVVGWVWRLLGSVWSMVLDKLIHRQANYFTSLDADPHILLMTIATTHISRTFSP